MTNQFQEFIEFLKTPFPHFFIILSLAVSIILLTSDDFVQTLVYRIKNDEVIKVNADVGGSELEESKFTVCYINNGTSMEEVLHGFAKVVGFFLIFPAIISTNFFIGALQADYPNLSHETLELFAILAFIYFNANFWLLLSYTMKSFHDIHSENRSSTEPTLSILAK